MAVSAPTSEAVAAPRGGLREQLVAYKDLAKLDVFDVYLSIPLAWTLLEATRATQAETFVVLALMLLFNVGYLAATCAFDDVQGIRDNIDQVNYTESATLRKRKRKPLLDNRLTEREAIRFGWASVLVAVLAGAGAFAVAGFEPWWFVPLAAVVIATAVSYSWGPKLSYIAGQEFVFVAAMTMNLCVMVAITSGGLGWLAVLEGIVLALWVHLIAAFANINDREGDRQAGRMTVPVRLALFGALRFTAGEFVVAWALLAAGVATGVFGWWVVALQAPAIAMGLVALRAGILHLDALAGRLATIRVHRLSWLGFVVANLILMR
jgi:1,4-dihydroxy-2-naphthoate octaprenyltransferase